MSPMPLPDLILLAAVLAGAGAFLLTLGALRLFQVALARLVLSLLPRAAHDQRLQAALDRYRPAPGAQPHKRRPR